MDLGVQRRLMVERQLRGRGIYDQRVLEAMLAIPREQFVPENLRRDAYSDEPLPIGHGQTISQPYMIALMAQCLQLEGGETVLEVGGGCGYHAAVLGALAAHVVTMELVPELAAGAEINLRRTGRAANVLVVCGDGSLGYPPLAPFDGISVAAAASEIPAPLLEQLRDPGRLVMPVGPSWGQELVVMRRQGEQTTSRTAASCRFVPLRLPAHHEVE